MKTRLLLRLHGPLRLLPLIAGLLAASLAPAQTPTATWTNVNHGLDAGYTELTSVAFGNGVFVAIAGTPIPAFGAPAIPVRIATSTDGLTWTGRSLNDTLFRPYISRVRFLNGRFIVAFGGQTANEFTSAFANFYATSPDGVTWTHLPRSTTAGFTELIFVNGRYYNVGVDGLASSADLATWTTHPTPLTGIFSYLDIAFGNGRFFATTNGTGGVVTSTDGTTWTQVPFFAQLGGYRVEFLNGTWFFYSQGNNAVSTDGTTFTSVARGTGSPGGTASILTMNGRIIAPGPGYYWAGINGRDWAQFGNWPSLPSSFNSYFEVAFGAGRYVAVGSALGTGRIYRPLVITLAESDAPALVFPVAPALVIPLPTTVSAILGRSTTLSVTATGTGNTYQWQKNTGPAGAFVAIGGAITANYTIDTVTAASVGSYNVIIRNSVGSVTAGPFALNLVPAAQAGRLINLSVLTDVATPGSDFTLGYVVGGAGTAGAKPLVIRAAGPSLGAFGLAGTLDDPKLETFAGATSTGGNDNWGGSTQLTAALASVGAFAYSGPTSRDAAVSTNINTRDNSVVVSSANNGTGAVIAEVYDATPAANFAVTTPRLLNVSVRKHLGAGVTAGFVLGGTTPTRVLIRVVGPGLAAFGVGDTVVDPQLTLFAGSTKIAENNDWAGAGALTAAFSSVGAFALPGATSKDAVLLVSLQPGNYSVLATGVNTTTGVALVEVYEVP